MHRRSSLVATLAAVAAAAVLGVAPAATAAPAHGRPSHAAASSHAPSISKDARRLSLAKTLVTREVARKDTALARTTRAADLGRIDGADADTVLDNVAADRSILAGLGQSVAAATTLAQVSTVAIQVAQVRPETYSVVLSALVKIAAAQAVVVDNELQVADLAAQADELEAQGVDVTDVRAALDAVSADDSAADDAAATAHDLALALTATCPLKSRAAVGQQLVAVAKSLVAAAADLQVAADDLAALQPAPAV